MDLIEWYLLSNGLKLPGNLAKSSKKKKEAKK